MDRQWQFVRSANGGDPVTRDLQKCKLNVHERARLSVLMERIRDRTTQQGDVKPLGDGLLEARLSGDGRIFRLVYVEVNGGLILLGLHFFQKRSQQTQRREIRAAQKRLKEWRTAQKKP